MHKNTSNRINWLKGFLCMMIVFVHAQNTDYFNSASVPWISSAEQIIIRIAAYIGVSGFFFLSGYLFFRNFTVPALVPKLLRRTKTLLLPFIVWNAVYYLLYTISSRALGLRSLFDGMYIPITADEMFQALIMYKYNPVFWFMQHLIVFIVATPLIWLLIKNKYVGALSVILLTAVSVIPGFQPYTSPYAFIQTMTGFLFGGYSSVHLCRFFENDKKRIMGIAAVITLAVLMIWYLKTDSIIPLQLIRLCSGACLMTAAAVCEFPAVPDWMQFTFFIYASHQIMLAFINKAAARLVSDSMYLGGFLFLALPWLVIIVLSWIAGIIQRRIPRACVPLGIPGLSKTAKSI